MELGEMEVAEPRARQPPTLPMDILLEIIARSDDVTTVVRCAAACKPLRCAMVGPGFLDRLRRRAEANGGFDPSLLMAVSYRPPAASSTSTCTNSIVVQPPGRLRHFDTELLAGSSGPLSSRDGLLVVYRHGILVVCNTITGQVTSLPSMGQGGINTAGICKLALLSIHDAGRSFELLVMHQKHPPQGTERVLQPEDLLVTGRRVGCQPRHPHPQHLVQLNLGTKKALVLYKDSVPRDLLHPFSGTVA